MGICTQVCIDKFGWKRGAVKGSTFVVDDHAMKCGSYRLEKMWSLENQTLLGTSNRGMEGD